MKSLKTMLRRWIPGIISGGADNDPAGIATYSVSGAQFGYGQLWLMVLATPMLIAVQAMCGRLGLVKRKGLISIIKDHYAPIFVVVSSATLILANILTIGADVSGVSAAVGLITNTNYVWWIIPVVILIWYMVVFKNFRSIQKYLLWLNILFVAYIGAAILTKPNWIEVLKNLFIPTLSLDVPYLMAAMGLLGTTITPFLFFWQVQEEVEGPPKTNAERVFEIRKEDMIMAPGFIFSNIISLCIMISTATVFHSHGITDIQTAGDAARGLEPLAGGLAKYLFGIGIIGAGFVAIPILSASAGAAVAEIFGWRDSLSDKLNHAKGFYAVISASLVVGMLIAFLRINPIKALFYSQIISGMVGPILIVLILFICNDKKIMGAKVNGWFDNLFGALSVLIMALGTAGLLLQIIPH
jgi:Mn2+/Fe2+ NRAMP family transporter